MTLTPAAQRSINDPQTGEVWVQLVRLNRAEWAEPVFIGTDSVPTVSNGDTYQPYPFTVSLPDELEEGGPILNWVASNASLEILRELRGVTGAIDARVQWVLASDPNSILHEFDGLKMYNFSFDDETVTGDLKVVDVFSQPVSRMSMTVENNPALF